MFIISRLLVCSLRDVEESVLTSLTSDSGLIVRENLSVLDVRKYEFIHVVICNEKMLMILIYG